MKFPLYHDYIKQVLPHRPPFLFIDRIDRLEIKDKDSRENRCVEVAKIVAPDEPFFQGHFPGNPVMPGVIVLEIMGQAGLLAAFTPDDKYDCLLRSISQCKFRAPVTPGMEVKVKSEVTKDRSNMIHSYSIVTVDDKKVTEGEVVLYYRLH